MKIWSTLQFFYSSENAKAYLAYSGYLDLVFRVGVIYNSFNSTIPFPLNTTEFNPILEISAEFFV
jgi:hypothetical protein